MCARYRLCVWRAAAAAAGIYGCPPNPLTDVRHVRTCTHTQKRHAHTQKNTNHARNVTQNGTTHHSPQIHHVYCNARKKNRCNIIPIAPRLRPFRENATHEHTKPPLSEKTPNTPIHKRHEQREHTNTNAPRGPVSSSVPIFHPHTIYPRRFSPSAPFRGYSWKSGFGGFVLLDYCILLLCHSAITVVEVK